MSYGETLEGGLHGVAAEFVSADDVIAAARAAHAAGYQKMDAYSPFPVEGLHEALGRKRSILPWIIGLGALCGGSAGYALQYFTSVIDYPINIGGRPLHSWPAFVPVTFECTVLASAFCAVFGMIIANKLPQPYHSIFNHPRFDRASHDRFFLCLEADDPMFTPDGARVFLQGLHPVSVMEVPA